jgi:hypothetical protein
MNRVDEFQFEIAYEAEELAYEQGNSLSAFIRNRLSSIANEECERVGIENGSTLQIECMEVNLGCIPWESYYPIAEERFRCSVREQLEEYLLHLQSGADPGAWQIQARIQHSDEKELEIVLHYLDTGSVAWNSEQRNSSSVRAMIRKLLHRDGRALLEAILQSPLSEHAARRLSALLDHDTKCRYPFFCASPELLSELDSVSQFLEKRNDVPWYQLLIEAIREGDRRLLQPFWSLMLDRDPVTLRELLKEYAANTESCNRMAANFEEERLSEMVEVLEPLEAEFVHEVTSRAEIFLNATADNSIEPTKARISLWALTLHYLLVERGSHFNRRKYLGSVIRGMAQHSNQDYKTYLHTLSAALRQIYISSTLQKALLRLTEELEDEELHPVALHLPMEKVTGEIAEERGAANQAESFRVFMDRLALQEVPEARLMDFLKRSEHSRQAPEDKELRPVALRLLMEKVTGEIAEERGTANQAGNLWAFMDRLALREVPEALLIDFLKRSAHFGQAPSVVLQSLAAGSFWKLEEIAAVLSSIVRAQSLNLDLPDVDTNNSKVDADNSKIEASSFVHKLSATYFHYSLIRTLAKRMQRSPAELLSQLLEIARKESSDVFADGVLQKHLMLIAKSWPDVLHELQPRERVSLLQSLLKDAQNPAAILGTLPLAFIVEVAELAAPQRAPVAKIFLDFSETDVRSMDSSSPVLQKAAADFTLFYTATDRGGESNRFAFLQSALRQVAAHHNLNVETLASALLKQLQKSKTEKSDPLLLNVLEGGHQRSVLQKAAVDFALFYRAADRGGESNRLAFLQSALKQVAAHHNLNIETLAGALLKQLQESKTSNSDLLLLNLLSADHALSVVKLSTSRERVKSESGATTAQSTSHSETEDSTHDDKTPGDELRSSESLLLWTSQALKKPGGNFSSQLMERLQDPHRTRWILRKLKEHERRELLMQLLPQRLRYLIAIADMIRQLIGESRSVSHFEYIYHFAFVLRSPLFMPHFARNYVEWITVQYGYGTSAHAAQKILLELKRRPASAGLLDKHDFTKALRKIAAANAGQRSVTKSAAKLAITIQNAGLILASPFIPRLFSMLEFTEEGRFKSEELQQRAICLLEYAVNEGSEYFEGEMLLNKILCGLEPETFLPGDFRHTAEEAEAVDGMLRAMIEHWSALGKTSIAGLRESFLAREGRLRFDQDAWQLRVEGKSFDVLLDRIPWSYKITRYPWMKSALNVEWR